MIVVCYCWLQKIDMFFCIECGQWVSDVGFCDFVICVMFVKGNLEKMDMGIGVFNILCDQVDFGCLFNFG